MKPLNPFFKPSIIISLVCLFITSNPLIGQDLTGKWESLLYNEKIHFHKEGILRIESESGDAYGMYAIEDHFLAIAFFNEEETRVQYTISFDEEDVLSLQEAETGEIYPFTYAGEAVVPSDVLEQVRLALNSEEEVTEDVKETSYEVSPPVRTVNIPTQNTASVENNAMLVKNETLPGTLPTPGTRGRTGIVGTWTQEYSAIGAETLVLTADGYFAITAESQFPDLYPPTFGYGRYDYENGKLSLHFFNAFQLYEKETVLHIQDLNSESMNIPYDLYGDIQPNRYLYKGAPVLHESHRRTLLAWVTFHRMLGKWRSENSVLKFMGDGDMMVEDAKGAYSLAHYSVAADGVTAQFKHIDADESNFFYTGKVKEFTAKKLTLVSDASGEPEVFTYEGSPQLTAEQTQVMLYYMNAKHRTTMSALDMIDGVQDWIWVEKKY